MTAVIGVLVTVKSLVFGPPDRGRTGALVWRPLLVIVVADLAIGGFRAGRRASVCPRRVPYWAPTR